MYVQCILNEIHHLENKNTGKPSLHATLIKDKGRYIR